MCITHGVFFFRIGKDALHGLFSFAVQVFPFVGSPQLLYNVQIFLPDVSRHQLLAFFVCPTGKLVWAASARLWRTAVSPFSFFARCCMSQFLALWTKEYIFLRIILVFPRAVRSFFVVCSCIRQDRDPSIVQYFLCNPRCFVACVHYHIFCFREFFSYLVIYRIPCHAVMHISSCHFHCQYKTIFVTGGMRLICKLPLMLSLYKHAAVRICCGNSFLCHSSGRLLVIIVLILNPLFAQLLSFCVDLASELLVVDFGCFLHLLLLVLLLIRRGFNVSAVNKHS